MLEPMIYICYNEERSDIMLEENKKVEDFTLLDDEGNEWTLSKHLDKKVIIYFYPKDNTPGCTTQACTFRDNYDIFKSLNAYIIGISADSVKSHANFKAKKELPFTLLSDPDKKVIQYFGAFGEKKMFGKTYDGIIRSTFIIDENQNLIKVYKKASPTKNPLEIIDFLRELNR